MQNWLDYPILKATNNYYLLIILTTLNSEESSEGSGIVPGSLRSSSNVNLLILWCNAPIFKPRHSSCKETKKRRERKRGEEEEAREKVKWMRVVRIPIKSQLIYTYTCRWTTCTCIPLFIVHIHVTLLTTINDTKQNWRHRIDKQANKA